MKIYRFVRYYNEKLGKMDVIGMYEDIEDNQVIINDYDKIYVTKKNSEKYKKMLAMLRSDCRMELSIIKGNKEF